MRSNMDRQRRALALALGLLCAPASAGVSLRQAGPRGRGQADRGPPPEPRQAGHPGLCAGKLTRAALTGAAPQAVEKGIAFFDG